MNKLAFEIKPSPTSNDHETRVRIDESDWLGQEHLGLDPTRLFSQAALIEGGELLIGRCECGCEGCDDVWVDVVLEEHEVVWTDANGLGLHFDRHEYFRVVSSAREDFSWEDTKRNAERLVSGVFKDVVLEGGYAFEWASARVREGLMTLSFSTSGTQKVLEFSWDGQSPEDALAGARRFYKDRFEHL